MELNSFEPSPIEFEYDTQERTREEVKAEIASIEMRELKEFQARFGELHERLHEHDMVCPLSEHCPKAQEAQVKALQEAYKLQQIQAMQQLQAVQQYPQQQYIPNNPIFSNAVGQYNGTALAGSAGLGAVNVNATSPSILDWLRAARNKK